MKIAIVSTDGIYVDEHFGRAERFLIYKFTPTNLEHIDEREAVPLSVGDKGHRFDNDRFNKIIATIKDCDRVYIKQIGEKPAAKLRENGIEPMIYSGPIKHIEA